MKLYVGNLPYQAAESDLQDLFTQAGVNVDSVTLVRDRFTGEARGFGFVEVKDEDGELAIRTCNGKQLMGRAVVVNEARPQTQQGGGGGGGRPRSGGGGAGGGGSRGGPRRPPRW
jgi:RNA recognition motif-containing protein